MTNVTLTVPEGRTPSGTVCTERGVHQVIDGQVTVDIRDVRALLDAGFTNDDIPDLSNVSAQQSVTLEAPEGFNGIVLADGVAYPVVDGEVTLPRRYIRALILAGYSLPPDVFVVAENRMNGESFFLSGEEVEPTSFFSSGYNATYHTEEGIAIPLGEDIHYAPQLDAAVVDLLKQPCTIVLDGVTDNTDDPTESFNSKFYLLCDEAVYFEYEMSEGGVYITAGGNEGAGNSDFGLESTPPGRYRLVVTHTSGQLSASLNGGPVVTLEGDELPYEAITTVVLGVRFGAKITEFSIYTTPVDDADLSTLSALE